MEANSIIITENTLIQFASLLKKATSSLSPELQNKILSAWEKAFSLEGNSLVIKKTLSCHEVIPFSSLSDFQRLDSPSCKSLSQPLLIDLLAQELKILIHVTPSIARTPSEVNELIRFSSAAIKRLPPSSDFQKLNNDPVQSLKISLKLVSVDSLAQIIPQLLFGTISKVMHTSERLNKPIIPDLSSLKLQQPPKLGKLAITTCGAANQKPKHSPPLRLLETHLFRKNKNLIKLFFAKNAPFPLPKELLEEILSHLPTSSLWLLGKVCKFFNYLIRFDEETMSKIMQRNWRALILSDISLQLSPKLQQLAFKGYNRDEDETCSQWEFPTFLSCKEPNLSNLRQIPFFKYSSSSLKDIHTEAVCCAGPQAIKYDETLRDDQLVILSIVTSGHDAEETLKEASTRVRNIGLSPFFDVDPEDAISSAQKPHHINLKAFLNLLPSKLALGLSGSKNRWDLL